MPEISIIVPIYNSEKKLNRCIESILSQSFSDFELILINDGSSDSSKSICEFYQKKDNRIVIINQQNQGVSAARNNGIGSANGKYIMFCDSDDYVDYKWCENLYNQIKKNPDALIVCDVQKSDKITNNTFSATEELSYYELYKIGLSAYTPNKIYDASIIKNYNIKFDENCSFSEDVKFNIEYFKYCKRIILINQKLYYYDISDEGLTNSYKFNSFEKHLMPFYIRINNIEKEKLNEYCDSWLYQFINLFDNVFDKKNKNMSTFRKFAYNNQMIKTKEFQFCVDNSTDSEKLKKILKLKNYYIFWIFQNLIKFKKKLRSE